VIRIVRLTLLALLVSLSTACAQPPTQADQQKLQKTQQAPGADKQALLMKLLAQQGGGGIDPLVLMMMAKKGEPDMDELFGLSMVSRMFAAPTTPPVTLMHEDSLLIIDNGTVYKVNVETMKLDGTVQYRAQGAGNALAALAPMLGLAQTARVPPPDAPKAQAAPDAVQPAKVVPDKAQ